MFVIKGEHFLTYHDWRRVNLVGATWIVLVQRTADTQARSVEDMRVNHCGGDVFVP
jgi:hypothetical protein